VVKYKYLIISKDDEPFYVDLVNKKLTKQQKNTIKYFKLMYKDFKITYKICLKDIFLEW
jgi:hypothetical protein